MLLPNKKTVTRRLRRGFTLTELLVVVTIIAILAGLATAGAINALNAAKRTRISLEVKELERSMLTFKEEIQAFPPNLMNNQGNNLLGQPVQNIVLSDLQRTFKKAFPRHQEPPALLEALAGASTGPNNLPGGLNGAEALYFWLGGFSKDEQYPISGPGGPSYIPGGGGVEILEDRNRIYAFDLTRLRPRTSDGAFDDSPNNGRFVLYNDPRTNVQRRINLWQYGPSGSEQPFVYFDTSRHKPAEYDLDVSGIKNAGIFAVKSYRQGYSPAATFNAARDIVFANNQKFQVLHAGLDDIWGAGFQGFSIQNGANTLTFPAGPFTGDIADTLTNFTTGTLEDAQE